MKILKKVRLLNWHRFQDETIEFGSGVLLSGENGAGKSTILDAIQFVITCSKAHFNKAAHEKGKRNLNSYIRCKTGREDRPYERTGEITAHIALEFYDEAKKRSFIVGAVMDSASEEKEPNVAWYLMENKELSDDLFRKGNQVKSISAFRASNKGLHTFVMTVGEAKKMMLSRFGRLEDRFFSLIPKALAFKPIHDIKDFVYSYILDEKEVNIELLKENVRSYQDLERMLQDVKRRIEELTFICDKEKEVENYLRRDRNQEYYIARAAKELTESKTEEANQNIRYEELSKNEWTQKRLELTKSRDMKEQMLQDLAVELKSDTEYQAFRELERKEAALKEQLREDKLEVKELKRAVQQALGDAEKLLKGKAAGWLAGVQESGRTENADRGNTAGLLKQKGAESENGAFKAGQGEDAVSCVEEYRDLLEVLEECQSLAAVVVCLERVIAYKEKTYKEIQEQIAETNVEIRRKEEELKELNHRIRELEARRLVYPPAVTELQTRIREQFQKLGRKGEMRVLCEMLEVTDPKWQNAVEGYLNTQRFYLLAEPQDFDVALSVYEKMREQRKVYGVGLINTAKLEEYEESPEGSLAQVVTSKNMWARRYCNMVLGKVHRCNSYQELKKYSVSITRQCMRYQNHVVSAIKPEIFQTPYIGAEAYKKQLEQCVVQRNELEAKLQLLKETRDHLNFMVEPLSTSHDIDVKYRLKALEDMRAHERALSECKEAMKQLEASQTMIQKRIRLEELGNEKKQLDKQVEEAVGMIARCEQKIVHYEEQISELRDLLVVQSAELARLADQLQEDLPECEKEYKRQTGDKELEKYRENIERARKSNWTQKEKAEEAMITAMRAYKVAHDFGAAESLAGYPEFRAEYEKLKNSQLLEYEEKVYQARTAAEEEFKEQFLSRLQENIKQAQGEFKELNRALKEIHFSKEQYEFLYEPSGKLKKFYQMIMSDFNVMQGESIFSGLFNATHKEVIDELFEKLTQEDENSSKTLEEYTDYRTYMDYDIKISSQDGSYMLYSKVSQEKSGGETQTPFYITIAASFMQLYRNSIGGDSIGLVMMDEAFNNMDDERIAGVLSFMTHSNLQLIIAAPPDKIQYIGPAMQKVLLVLQDGNFSYVEDFTRETIR